MTAGQLHNEPAIAPQPERIASGAKGRLPDPRRAPSATRPSDGDPSRPRPKPLRPVPNPGTTSSRARTPRLRAARHGRDREPAPWRVVPGAHRRIRVPAAPVAGPARLQSPALRSAPGAPPYPSRSAADRIPGPARPAVRGAIGHSQEDLHDARNFELHRRRGRKPHHRTVRLSLAAPRRGGRSPVRQPGHHRASHHARPERRAGHGLRARPPGGDRGRDGGRLRPRERPPRGLQRPRRARARQRDGVRSTTRNSGGRRCW